MELRRPSLLGDAVRVTLFFLGSVFAFVWVFTAVDDILYHTPYCWGQWCGEPNLSALGRYGCKAVCGYYFSLDAHTIDSGVIAAVFLILSSVCVTLLWAPRFGALRAVVRTWLLVVPAEVVFRRPRGSLRVIRG